MFLLASLCAVFFPHDVLEEIWDLIESFSAFFSTYCFGQLRGVVSWRTLVTFEVARSLISFDLHCQKISGSRYQAVQLFYIAVCRANCVRVLTYSARANYSTYLSSSIHIGHRSSMATRKIHAHLLATHGA